MKNLLDSKTDEQLNDISNIVKSHLSEHYEEIEKILKKIIYLEEIGDYFVTEGLIFIKNF